MKTSKIIFFLFLLVIGLVAVGYLFLATDRVSAYCPASSVTCSDGQCVQSALMCGFGSCADQGKVTCGTVNGDVCVSEQEVPTLCNTMSFNVVGLGCPASAPNSCGNPGVAGGTVGQYMGGGSCGCVTDYANCVSCGGGGSSTCQTSGDACYGQEFCCGVPSCNSNSVKDPNEQCDNGLNENGECPLACSSSCKINDCSSNISIDVNPTSKTVAYDSTTYGAYNITVSNWSYDSGEQVTLSLTGCPQGATCSLTNTNFNLCKRDGPEGCDADQVGQIWVLNAKPTGAYKLNVIARASDGGVKSKTVDLIINPPPQPVADIKVNGGDAIITNLPNGTPVTLSWTSRNAVSCAVNPGGWTDTSNSGVSSGPLQSSKTYTIICTSAYGAIDVDAVTILVVPPPLSVISANPLNFTFNANWGQMLAIPRQFLTIKNTGTATLLWSATNENPTSSTNHPSEYCYFEMVTGSSKILDPGIWEDVAVRVVQPTSFQVGAPPGPGRYSTCKITVSDTSGKAASVDVPVIYNIGIDPTIPNPIMSLTATQIGTCDAPSVRLDWSVPGDYTAVSGFGANIWRSDNGGVPVKIKTNVDLSTGSYIDNTIFKNNTYYYQLEIGYHIGQADEVIYSNRAQSNNITVSCAPSVGISADELDLPSGNSGTKIDWWSSNITPGSCVISHTNPSVSSWKTGDSGVNQATGPLPAPGRTYRITCDPPSTASVSINVNAPASLKLCIIKSGQGIVVRDSAAPGVPIPGEPTCWNYPPGEAVNLTATPAWGRRLTGWGGDCNASNSNRNADGTSGTCNLIMNESRTARVNFALDPNYEEF